MNQWMHNAVTHHSLTDARPVPEQWGCPPLSTQFIYLTPYAMKYPCG